MSYYEKYKMENREGTKNNDYRGFHIMRCEHIYMCIALSQCQY